MYSPVPYPFINENCGFHLTLGACRCPEENRGDGAVICCTGARAGHVRECIGLISVGKCPRSTLCRRVDVVPPKSITATLLINCSVGFHMYGQNRSICHLVLASRQLSQVRAGGWLMAAIITVDMTTRALCTGALSCSMRKRFAWCIH